MPTLTVIGGPFIWKTYDRWGHPVALTPSSWNQHVNVPGHLTPEQWQWVIETAEVTFWDVSDHTMKYIRSAVVGKTVKILVMVVNTQTTPWTVRTGFLTSKLSRRYQVSHEGG